jgi:alpha-tubulin suppressor-like RCC1 family protein
MRYNSSAGLEFCDGVDWITSISSLGCVGPNDCPTPGSVCSDGSVYAGCRPDGKFLYTTRCDLGRTYSGGCSGARTTPAWDSGTTEVTGATSNLDGAGNTSTAVSQVNVGNAVEACDSLTIHSKSDWYLPALTEVNIIQEYKSSIGDFPAGYQVYWTSTEASATNAYETHLGVDSSWSSDDTKSSTKNVRCVRSEGYSSSKRSGVPLENVSQITVMNDHKCVLKNDGTIWCWDFNDDGELGDGTAVNRANPVQESTAATDWAYVSAGNDHTCAVKTGGTLYCWGKNTDGQLGLGSSGADVLNPTQVGTDTDWASVSAMGSHTCAIKTGGTLYCWGQNGYGEIGNDTTGADQLSPLQVGTDTNWASVSGGWNHTCARKTNGTIYCTGQDDEGQLGQGGAIPGTDLTTMTQVGTDTDWAYLDSGADYNCAVKTGGTLYCWGKGTNNQLGNGTAADVSTPTQTGTDTNWSIVGPGEQHTCALKTTGTMWCWGNGDAAGQAGDGMASSGCCTTPQQVGTDTDWSYVSGSHGYYDGSTVALKTNETAWFWGWSLANGNPVPVRQ